MTFKHRGEYEVEIGLGLPIHTTAGREAYVPSNPGYTVFDTDLGVPSTYLDVIDGWSLGIDASVVSDKIDILDGIGKNTLTLADTESLTALSLSAITTVGTISTPTQLTLGIDGVSTIQLTTTNVTLITPFIGLDGTGDNDFVTRSQAGRYQAAFVVGDFVSGDLTITAATHGLPFTAGDAYDIQVYDTASGNAEEVTISAGTNTLNGDVIVSTVGAAFNGRINISR